MKSGNKNKIVSPIMPDLGHVPPQAVEMEEAVLGAVMLERDAILKVLDIIKPERFYKEAHQKIYSAIMQLYAANKPVDIMTVTEQLRNNHDLEIVGGPVYITQLSSKVVSSSHVEYHGRIIAQKWMQREIIRISTQLQAMAFDESYDVTELFEFAEKSLFDLSGTAQKKQPKHISQVLNNVIDTVEMIQNGSKALVGVPTGFTKLDRMTAGLKKKELFIIAGRPSMGKTAFALQVGKNAASLGYPVLIFSLEMPEEQLGIRYLSGPSGKTNVEILNAKCNIDDLVKASYEIAGLPIYIDDTSAISAIEIKAKATKFIIEKGVKLLVVDYIQLMSGEGDNREQVVSGISRDLKSIAKDLDIPIIALSQLNRDVEKTADKKPGLSDLRESGAIEQDADVVAFVYRPAKYKLDTIEVNGSSVLTKGLIDIIIGKNRSGPVDDVLLQHNESLTHIYQPDEYDSNSSSKLNPKINDLDMSSAIADFEKDTTPF